MDIHNDAVFVQILSFYLYPMIEFSFWYLCIFSDTHFLSAVLFSSHVLTNENLQLFNFDVLTR